jgi:DNA-binding NtrC family response regulator
MNTNSILIVDDEKSYLDLLKGLLVEEGFTDIITETNPLNAIDILHSNNVDLVLCDVYMPQMNGLELLERITLEHPHIPVIMVTAISDVKIALKAIEQGAYEFITKPPDIDRLIITIKRALEKRLLSLERDALREISVSSKIKWQKDFAGLVTESSLMYKVFELVEIFAPTNETILITGETGTGKDLIAKKIHNLSPRKSGPFLVVNLASISPTLFESELFGHEKGSFTGATNDKAGYFESANGGTIFLDEIGELPRELQGKLLRTIQYNEIFRIGSSKPIKLDTRIIAATNRNMMSAIKKNEFRSDLYYRLTRGFITLPPLRKREGDIKLLANYFLTAGNLIYKKNILGITDEAFSQLEQFSFPGNVRELENIILNTIAQTKDKTFIEHFHLPDLSDERVSLKSMAEDDLVTIDDAVKLHIIRIMNHTNQNIQKAAAILGVSERTLQRRLQEIRNNKIKPRQI